LDFIIKILSKAVKIKIVPIITWIPWNPVVMKKDEPKIESEIVNGAFLYSHHWRIEKYNPIVIVIIILLIVWFSLFLRREWWAHVIEAPELTKMIVLRRGISIGLNGVTPLGGHFIPISILGASLECKNLQKKDRKNIISDIINIIIPILIISLTIFVWSPLIEDSRFTSRHHWVRLIIIVNLDK